jgi:osmotically-inducible protein OsmY
LQANPALNAVQVQVAQGVAYLSGHVETEADKVAADAVARSTPGVQDVDNALSPDDALFGRVTAALLADPRIEEIPIEVIADRGTITLKGVVPSQEVKRAAEAITRRVPGVVAVINELEIRHKEPELGPEGSPGGAPARVIYIPPLRN